MRPAPALSPGIILLAISITGLGVLAVASGDFAMVWQPVPPGLPGRELLAYLFGGAALVAGPGLLWARTRPLAAGVVVIYLLLWLVALRLTAIVASPGDSGAWLGMGENAVMLAGSLVLVIRPSGAPLRAARTLLALGLLACGQGHFYFLKETAAAVPAWLPGHTVWAAATGAGFVAAAAGILFSIYPRLAATLVTAMVGSFAALVWAPGVLVKPTDRFQWTGLMVSLVITAGAWLVAETYESMPWLSARAARSELPAASG